MANNSDKIDNSELKLLIKKRGSCKAQLTQFETFLSRLDGCDGLSELLKTELGIRMKKIELLQSDFDKLQCEIELLSDNVDEAYADRDQFESKLFRLLSVAHGLLAAAARYPAAGAPGGDGTSDAAEECRGGGFVRLPKIDLPHFDGDYQHWLSFRDTYISLIHDNTSINNQILFRFDANEPIKSYTLNTATYGTASAPYLATKCLVSLAETTSDARVQEAIRHDFFVDDYLGGGDSVESVVEVNASERAYASCVYIRTIRNDGTAHVCLLTSKNKVAPIKPTTIPRLELCGALLGTRLCKKVLDSLTVKIDQCYYWSDSTIVLGWLNTATSRLERFVRNRVNEIQESTAGDTWSYVPSKQNPADLVSRG
ncbi:unnamed protein product [Plutella xylostella]|uniref:(diamondback moth) hypothetical protein n=1 Tax=Plutella xylostella TaxID=51655 RepID=A0A8S4GCA1_PLUXY|nr:unnamed protein product [Plutella xylostella]